MQVKPVINTVDAIEETETEDFDRQKLLSYLNKTLLIESDWSKSKIYKCSSGYSNPPYIIDCGSNKYILRTKHDPLSIMENHPNLLLNIKEQYKLISILDAKTDVPVPKMYLFCDDDTVIGKIFYIMQFIEGRMFTHSGPDLPTLPKQDRAKVYKEIVHVLSLIHSVDIDKTGIYDIIKDKCPFTIHQTYTEWKSDFNKVYKDKNISKNVLEFGRIMNERYIEHETNNNDLHFNELIHGDFHLENIIWHPDEHKIIAVVDWERCCVGNPIFELILCLRMYRTFATQDVMNLDPPFEYHTGFRYIDVKKLGIPTETESILNYLYYANKALSPEMMHKIRIWLRRENNWSFGAALVPWFEIALFYQLFKEEHGNDRIKESFGGKRQYVMLDSAAAMGLLAIQEPLSLKIPSKL